MSKDKFLIKRLVMVDSAGLCYIELPVDRHAMLLGKGNVGKSSLLNAIRLFLLPENNFKNSKNKFAFKVPNKDDYYSNDDSYNHYFPSSRSFLILEVENFVGTHCQVLYRSQNMGFNRIFTPLAYDQIRSLFWQAEGDEDGIGRAVSDLSASKVSDTLKRIAPKTVLASETSKLKRILYANDFLDVEAMRYCLFPLTETDESRIESLRTLILLLFEMNTGSDSVSRAVASIIEADKKYASDALEFDIDAFLRKHVELKEKKHALTRIRNFEPRFSDLKKDYDEYTKLGEVDSRFCKLTQRLEIRLIEIRAERSRLADIHQESERICKESERALRQLQNDKRDKDVLIRDRNKTITEQQKVIDVVDDLKLQYASNYPVSEILQITQDALVEVTDQREALIDEDKSAERVVELNRLIERGKETEESLQQRLLNEEYRLDAQLPTDVLEPLTAVNKRLVLANPCRSLTELEVGSITEFSRLFDCSLNRVKWFDQEFPKQSQAVTDDVEKQLQKVQQDLLGWQESLSDLNVSDTTLTRQKKIETAGKELKKLERELDALKRYDIAKDRLSSAQEELMALDEDLEAVDEKIQAQEGNNETLKNKVAQSKAELDIITVTHDEINEIAQRQRSLCSFYPRLKQALETFGAGESMLKAHVVTLQDFEQVDNDLRQLEKLRDKIINELREAVHEGILEDDGEIRTQVPSSRSVKHCKQRIADVYTELPQQELVLTHQVHEHNESVASYIKVLTDNHEHVQRFESQLNRDFSEVRINDLEQISVSISVHPKFRNLISEINKLDLHGDTLPSDEFYERLRIFVGEFFKGGADAKLTMDKIVTNLSYRTRKVGEERLQSKQQSNSTTALINFEMVQVLLNKVLHSSANVAMPLVLDEAATIDLAQFDWLLPHLSQRGFSLFAASTYSASAELIHKIGVYHEIGMMKTSQPYHKDRSIVYWGGGEGFFAINDPSIMDISVVDQEQISLLGGEL